MARVDLEDGCAPTTRSQSQSSLEFMSCRLGVRGDCKHYASVDVQSMWLMELYGGERTQEQENTRRRVAAGHVTSPIIL